MTLFERYFLKERRAPSPAPNFSSTPVQPVLRIDKNNKPTSCISYRIGMDYKPQAANMQKKPCKLALVAASSENSGGLHGWYLTFLPPQAVLRINNVNKPLSCLSEFLPVLNMPNRENSGFLRTLVHVAISPRLHIILK